MLIPHYDNNYYTSVYIYALTYLHNIYTKSIGNFHPPLPSHKLSYDKYIISIIIQYNM